MAMAALRGVACELGASSFSSATAKDCALRKSIHHSLHIAATRGSILGEQALLWRSQLLKPPTQCRGRRLHVGIPALQALQKIQTDYLVKSQGAPGTLEYRAYLLSSSGKTVSPWHDIPLRSEEGYFHFVVEISKETSAKMEVATEETLTPFKQDTKKGKLRYYPYNIHWNYGLLPQTWEDPTHANPEIEGTFGDNDPVDVVEIGQRQAELGQVLKVKPLGVLAMIDEGELDWKVVAISVDDPKASLVNDVEDVEMHFPGTLTAIRNWFRDYKVPDGKPQNKFGLGNEAAGKSYALKVIDETHAAWVKLVTRSVSSGDLSLI